LGKLCSKTILVNQYLEDSNEEEYFGRKPTIPKNTMKLEYNKVISQKLDIYDEDEYKKRKEKSRRDDKKTLGRPEWVYYLWYLHLKLCLEMEEKGIPIQLRQKYRSGVKEQRKVSKIHRLKINRKVYEGIDWEDLKTLSWNQWKKRYLNVFMTGGTREIQHGDEWKCEPQFLYLEMDIRNTETVLVNQLKKILKGRKTTNLPAKMGVQGKPNYHSSIIGYNLIVGMIQGKNWEKLVYENLNRIELVSKENYEELDGFMRDFMKKDYTFKNEFEGFCFSNLHRYILDTQKVLYNVSQGRFFDKTQIPEGKWKTKWSPKLYTW